MFHNMDDKTCRRGVVMYVEKSMQANQIEVITDFCESVWVRIVLNSGEHCILGCIYRSPNSTEENNNYLIKLINEVCANLRENEKIVIMGDFNLPDIDWQLMKSRSTNGFSTNFVDVVQDNYLNQMVAEPTRARNG